MPTLHGSQGDVAELADALDLGSSSFTECRFDSCHPHSLNDSPHFRRRKRRASFRPDTPIETAPGDTAELSASMPQLRLQSAAGCLVPCMGRGILRQEPDTNLPQRCFPWCRVMSAIILDSHFDRFANIPFFGSRTGPLNSSIKGVPLNRFPAGL